MAFFYNGTEIENISINDMFSEQKVVQRIYCEISKGNKKLVYEKKPPILVAGTSTGLWYSEDMGANWTQSNITSGNFGNRDNKSDDVGYNNIVYSPLYKKFFAHADSSDKGYLYISDDGKTWTTFGATKYWTDLQVSGNGYVYCSGANTTVRTGHVFYYDENNNAMQNIGLGHDQHYYILKDKVSNICYLYNSLKRNIRKLSGSSYDETLIELTNFYVSVFYELYNSCLANGILTVGNVYEDTSGDNSEYNYKVYSYNIIEKNELGSLEDNYNSIYEEPYNCFYENGLHIITSSKLEKIWYDQIPININNLSTVTSVNNYFDDITSYKTDDGIAHFLIKKDGFIYNTTSLDSTWEQELNDASAKLPTEVKMWDLRWKKYLFYPSYNKLYIRDITNNGAIQTITTNFGDCYQIVANQ